MRVIFSQNGHRCTRTLNLHSCRPTRPSGARVGRLSSPQPAAVPPISSGCFQIDCCLSCGAYWFIYRTGDCGGWGVLQLRFFCFSILFWDLWQIGSRPAVVPKTNGKWKNVENTQRQHVMDLGLGFYIFQFFNCFWEQWPIGRSASKGWSGLHKKAAMP